MFTHPHHHHHHHFNDHVELRSVVQHRVRGSHHVVTEEDERPPADHLPVDHGQPPLGLLVLAFPRGVGAQQLGAGQAVAPGSRGDRGDRRQRLRGSLNKNPSNTSGTKGGNTIFKKDSHEKTIKNINIKRASRLAGITRYLRRYFLPNSL